MIQKLIRWMPVILFVLYLMVDRDNSFHVVGFLLLLFLYTAVLIARILYARQEWHKEFNDSNLGANSSIQKMSDLKDELESNEST